MSDKMDDVFEKMRKDLTNDQLRSAMNKGIDASSWKKHSYTQRIFERILPIIKEFKERKEAIPLSSFKIQKNGEQIYWNLLADEQFVFAYQELILNVDRDIEFGKMAEKVLASSKPN